jgi:hypothetical protein
VAAIVARDRTGPGFSPISLHAEFKANAFSSRLEGGYRFTTFDLPAYAEQATVGSNAFVLAFSAASFTVNGATQAHDSALATASDEMKWINGWSAAATFEGEFSNVTSSYAGKGVVRYTW